MDQMTALGHLKVVNGIILLFAMSQTLTIPFEQVEMSKELLSNSLMHLMLVLCALSSVKTGRSDDDEEE